MPPKKDTTKSSTTETSEDETSCTEQLETLQLQLEEAWAVARKAQERVLTAEEDREWILERAREYEATAEDKREKVTELQQKLSQNYKHLERCTHNNARLSDELLEKSREAEAARQAAIMAQCQSFNMRNQIHQQGISPPVSPMMHVTPHVQHLIVSFRDHLVGRHLGFPVKSHYHVKLFMLLSASCGWSQEEKLFWLANSLCDKASEYAFGYLPNEALQSFDVLVAALEVQFKDRSPVTSYLAQLEAINFNQGKRCSWLI